MKRILETAIQIAKNNFDEYNHFRFTSLLFSLEHGNELTIAEKHDVKFYVLNKGK